jgi:hypothetical protein
MSAKSLRTTTVVLLTIAIGIFVAATPAVVSAQGAKRTATSRARGEAPPNVFDSIKGAPTKSDLRLRYADADAVVLFDSLVVSRDADSRVSKRRHRAVVLFTDNAINRYSDPRILFNAAKQELTVLTARVYMRDGTIVDTQKNGINQTTPFAFEAAPDYTDWQETVVTHVGIEKGCIAELQYVIADRDPSPWLSGVEILSAEDPTLDRTLEVRLPAGVALKHASWNGAPAPAAPSPGMYAWTARDIPGRTPFGGGAWEGDYFPTVAYGTAASWREVFSAIERSLSEALRDVGALRGAVEEAMKNRTDDDDRILAVHRVALEAVSGLRASFALFAATARDADRVYESAYATPLDRAVLLMAMLKAAGFNAVPVLVSSGLSPLGDVPAPELFAAVFVAVPTARGAELLLDPGAPYEHDPGFTLAGKTLVRLDGAGTVVRLPLRDANESRTTLDLTLKPGTDGTLDGEGVATMTGLLSPYYLVRGTGSETEKFLKARVKDLLGGAEVAGWNPLKLDADDVEIAFHFTVRLPDKKSGERVYLSLPNPFEAGLSGIERVRLERSNCPDAIKCEPSTLETSCTFEEPTGWRLVALPQPGGANNDVGSASVEVDSEPGAETVVRTTLTIQSDLVRPEAYGMLRALLLRFGEDRLVLERK